MRMPRPKPHNIGPTLLAVVGILVMLIGMALHWWRPDAYPVEWSVQFLGAAIAFVGFYAMDPGKAKDGGAFLLDAGTKIVGVIRGGRRSTDPPVVVTQPLEPAVPPGERHIVVDPVELPPPEPPEQPLDVPPLGVVKAKERGDL